MTDMSMDSLDYQKEKFTIYMLLIWVQWNDTMEVICYQI